MFAKFGFVHRRLWETDGLYRMALFFGPAPLLGGLLAGAVWFGMHTFARPEKAPDWAKPQIPAGWNTVSDQPQPVSPDRPLPSEDSNTGLSGYSVGWHVIMRPVEVSEAMDVDVKSRALSAFSFQGASLDMNQVIANAPKGEAATPLYAATAGGFLAIRTAGDYALTLHADRPAGQIASCIERLGFAGRRVVGNYDANLVDDVSKTFRPARFSLQPGLYRIAFALGCWNGGQETGPGRLTVLLSQAGEKNLHPIPASDILFPHATTAQ